MKLTYYRDKAGKWRWRLWARDRSIVACSAEGFSDKTDMLVNIELTANGLRDTMDQWYKDLHP